MTLRLKIQSLSDIIDRRLGVLSQTIQECNEVGWKQIPYYFEFKPSKWYTNCKSVEFHDGSFGVYFPSHLELTRIGSVKSGSQRNIYLAVNDPEGKETAEYFNVYRYYDNICRIEKLDLSDVPHPVLLQSGNKELLSIDLIQYHEKMGIKTYTRWEKLKTKLDDWD